MAEKQNRTEELTIADDQKCPRCDCCAVLINDDYEHECGFCGMTWDYDNPLGSSRSGGGGSPLPPY